MSHRGHSLVDGVGRGPVLFLSEPISFWGGVDPASGVIIDSRHPEVGSKVSATVTVVSHGRGSSSSSSVVAEMIRLGTAPAAMIVGEPDMMIVVGSLVAAELYGKVMPVARVSAGVMADLATASVAAVSPGGYLEID
ncbi:MAG TPA: DUF126 domain-containing protein [Acidimicrobiia bacterium]|nr:DUF126 domain-containing protein [Acidimicrobiia bacterium]